MTMPASKVQPVIVGGVVMGVLSALPIISAGNLCCCLWVVSGGVVSAALLQQNQTSPVTPAEGALAGLLAGMFGAVVYLVLSIPITILLAPLHRLLVDRLVDSGSLPPEFREYVAGYVGGALGAAVNFIAMLTAGIVFSTIGGLIGVAVFRVPQPPKSADVPPHI
jgi:hypothetical protein